MVACFSCYRTIAKNIVLVGDPQQLGSVISGNHPNKSGKSVLDYLLENKDTISSEKGIFLEDNNEGTSWRRRY